MASAEHVPGTKENPLMNTKEVAAILRCTPETVRMRILAGTEFPNATRAGRFWLVPKSDVDAILNRKFGA